MTYTAPTHHNLDALDALETALAQRRAEHKAAAHALAQLWDRIDAGEPISDEAARRRVGKASDAADAAQAAFIAEWRRVGSPLHKAVR